MKKLPTNIKVFLLLLVLSCGFLWLVLNPANVISELLKFPEGVKDFKSSLFSPDNLKYIEETRWNAFGPEKEEFVARLFYNKGYILIDQGFYYLSLLSPRIYFHSGDGTYISPPGVEPVAGIIFALWIMGVIFFVKDFKVKFVLIILVPFLSFISGRRNLVYLLPVLVIYLFISSKAIVRLNKNYRLVFMSIFVVLSLYLIGRMMWLS